MNLTSSIRIFTLIINNLNLIFKDLFPLCIFVTFSRNFGLLSFGEEAEEDEDQTNDFVKKNAGKAKSTHDVLDDPKLSKETGDLKKRSMQRN